MNADFTHLHVHTQFSLLDSALRLKSLFQKAADDKMEAVAMTDHGNMFGAIEFYLTAKKFGIKPILGCEMYLVQGSRLQKGNHENPDKDVAPYDVPRSGLNHLGLLVQNEEGYLNLCKLVSSGYLEGFYYKPRIDKEILAKHTKGLIATSACLKGEVADLILRGQMDEARKSLQWYQEAFEGRYYLELQQSGVPQQMMVNQRYQELAEDLGVPLIATADCHYLDQKDAYAQDVLMAIQTGRPAADDPSDVKSDQFYFKTQETMKNEFQFCPQAIENTMKIAESCDFEFKFTDDAGKQIYHFPKFEPPGGKTQVEYLRDFAAEGLESRWKENETLLGKVFTEEEKAVYRKRLERELVTIVEMGFTGYFLIVADFINAAKDRDIPVGPGRGSGAGSLVAYCMGITDLDPIPHGLIFERFLNPERVSLPDFDVDFCMEKREEIINYVVDKYGEDCVAQIITYGKLQARGVIRDVARTFGIAPTVIDPVAKLVPDTINITLQEAFEQEPRLRELTENDPQMAKLFTICRSLEGLYRHASIHAAGLVISNRPMVEHCPLYRGKNNEMVIQFDMINADRIGLIKFDFLGLKTLTVLRKAEKLIQSMFPEKNFILSAIDLKDKATYEMLCKGDTLGVFQLESSGMQDLMLKLKPDCFDDIVASNALYRPGPMGSGMLDDFINRKQGQTPVTYDFDVLEPILHETYGVIVYQEQVQQIAMTLAGYTAGGADLLRRAMGKKKAEEMEKQKKIFLEGSEKNKYDAAKAEKLFDLMAKFAGYGFNKSHAAAYSLITFQTAYIKCHFPEVFFAALLSIERENTDKVTRYIADAKAHDIEVLPPDINQSDVDFTVQPGRKIRFGLGAIKGAGQIAIDSVIESRETKGEFEDLYDVTSRTSNQKVNKRVIEAFIKAGAMDSFNVHRASLFAAVDEALAAGSALQKTRDDNQASFEDLFGEEEDVMVSERKVEYPDKEPWNRLEELRYEKETIGIYVTGHPLDDFETELKRYTTGTIRDFLSSGSAKDVLVGALVSGCRQIFTKRGDRMAFATLEDPTGQIEAVIFSDTYVENEDLIKGSDPIWVKAKLEIGERGTKLILSKKNGSQILPLRNAYEAMARELHLHLALENIGESVKREKLTRLVEFAKTYGPDAQSPFYIHLGVDPQATTVLKMKHSVPLKREAVDFIHDLFKEEKGYVDFR